MNLIEELLKNIPELKFELNLESLAKITGITIFGFGIFYCGKIWYAQNLFKRLGIKTPKYKFFFGNFPELLDKTESEALKEWTLQFGKTYGIYEGHLPILVTSDVEIIQEVFIKQFSNFIARKQYPFQFADNSPNMDLFLSSNKRWKRMRNVINPTFSPAKIKELMPIMKKCSNRFVEVLKQNTDKEIIISEFTFDTIWNCAVGMDIDCQNNTDNTYLAKSLLVFKDLEDLKFAFILTTYLNEFRPYILGALSLATFLISKLQNKLEDLIDPLFWLTQNIDRIVENRQENNITRRDFTQLLIEAETEYYQEQSEKGKIDLNKIRVEKKMSLDEIKFNLVGFLLAGFETTSTALNYCFYVLATHQEEMIKLQQEIDLFYSESDNEPDYDNISNLNYMDMFIKEVLRMYPISSNTVNRRCMFSTKVKDISIPAGLSVTVDVLSLHYDIEYWGPHDPEQFYPSRFLPEFKRSQLAYLPWGLGPRNCVGKRFAELEMKLALTKILLNYDIQATENTPDTLYYTEGTVRRPKNKIPILLRKRNQ